MGDWKCTCLTRSSVARIRNCAPRNMLRQAFPVIFYFLDCFKSRPLQVFRRLTASRSSNDHANGPAVAGDKNGRKDVGLWAVIDFKFQDRLEDVGRLERKDDAKIFHL